jgi:predicted PhzF superfamily epimerase YddE/YHI9
MVKLPYTVLNAFSSSADTGNAAAVIILPCPESAIDLADPFAAYPSTPALQKVATELNFPMTALLIPKGPAEDGSYLLRWLDPGTEVQLCGHATIALSHYLFSQPGAPARLDLTTVKHGQVISERLSNPLDKEDVRVALDFPEILGFRDIEPSSKEWEDVARGLGQVARSQSSPIRQLRRNDHYLIVELEGDFDMSAKGLPLDMEKLVCPHQRT